MSRRLFSNSLLRGIFDVAREIRTLTNPHYPSPAPETRTVLLRLPDVWAPSQYLINMGLRPTLARRLSSVYMDIVARYRQVFESYFRRAIQGSSHLNPEHYRNTFVVQFRCTIQVLKSQFMSTAWVWLCKSGLAPLGPQCIDVRVDAETRAQILSKLGVKTTSFITDATSNMIELPQEECNTEGYFPIKTLPASVPSPLRSTFPSIRDLFHSEKPSTCFPTRYPPRPSDSSPQNTLVTQLKLTPSAKNKPFANCGVDVSSLAALFGKMSATTSEAGFKPQEDRKYTWAPRSKKPEPPPLLNPITASVSGLPREPQSPHTEKVSPAKSVTTPRRRKIAALPKRHLKTATTASPIVDPSLPPAANLPVSRTPSLISDTSSCSDSFSSSDELDTPPSTPPSHPPALIACNASPTSLISSKSNTTGSFGFPMLTRAVFSDPRKGAGIHIDFTNGGAVGEQRFSFTFSA